MLITENYCSLSIRVSQNLFKNSHFSYQLSVISYQLSVTPSINRGALVLERIFPLHG